MVVLVVIGIVLLGGCIDTKDKNIPDIPNNNTTINNLNTTGQISDSTNKTNNTAINTTDPTTNTTTTINNTINETSNNTINNTNNKTDGNVTNTSSNKNIINTSAATNTSETPVQTTTIKTTIKNANAKEAHKLTDENSDNENFIIIDIRTLSEFNSGHIKDAINIDYYANDFVEQLKELGGTKTYLVYCRSGGRSGWSSMQNFQELKFEMIYHLWGGINSWKYGGFPVE